MSSLIIRFEYSPTYFLIFELFFVVFQLYFFCRIIFVNPLVDTVFIIEAPLFEVLMLTVR